MHSIIHGNLLDTYNSLSMPVIFMYKVVNKYIKDNMGSYLQSCTCIYIFNVFNNVYFSL